MKRSLLAASALLLIGLSTMANGDSRPSPTNGTVVIGAAPSVGAVIDRGNVDRFSAAMPPGLAFMIRHGLIVTIEPLRRIEWPLAYQGATEKYSGQVMLDDHDAIRHYVAGLPFPMIDSTDPKAGTEIAYNWRWGPFIPGEASIDSTQKTKAYVVRSSDSDQLISDDSQRDYRNENNCDRMTFVHYGVHDDKGRNPVNFKERGDACGPERGAVIGVEYLDAARNDDMWVFFPAVRRWRQMQMRGGYPHQSCTYSCVQFGWEYAPPKTEAYSYRLIGEQPAIACLDAPAIGAGIEDLRDPAHFTQLRCQVRRAYVLDMQPQGSAPEAIIAAKVYIDTETYLYLGGEFFRDRTPDHDFPIWMTQKGENGDAQMVLSNDFYEPADRPDFFIALNLNADSEKIDAVQTSESLFNPRAQAFSDGRM